MGFDFGAALPSFGSVGDSGGWGMGNSTPQATATVTDLSAHVDGGPASSRGSNVVVQESAKMNLYSSAAIVLAALVLLFLSGAIVFRSHNF